VGLLSLSILVIAIQSLGQGTQIGNIIAVIAAGFGYFGLRLLNRFARLGWDEAWMDQLEKALSRKAEPGIMHLLPANVEVHSPDTLDESRILQIKQAIEDRICLLRKEERLTLLFQIGQQGATVQEVRVEKHALGKNSNLEQDTQGIFREGQWIYSLVNLPVVTDPYWLSAQLERLHCNLQVIVSTRGLDPYSVRNQIDAARKRNARNSALPEVDEQVSFEEATQVLQGLSRGDEWIVEQAVVIIADQELNLDPHYFLHEKKGSLAVLSALGLRNRFYRSHWVRAVTAADLVPNLLDPKEVGAAVLKTARERDLYFDPQDSRLEALHWLVVGASGSGKSFFTGLLLRRMAQLGVPMSAFFIDHNRSFRRMIRQRGGIYSEPQNQGDIHVSLPLIFDQLNRESGMAGIELSDLTLDEKKASTHVLLSQVEQFLRTRKTVHPVYIVMDECWNFMRDEPVLVQRFFREFRKLNGAAVAITQSLSDFLTDESGRSIFQNAPIRILLRQGEDLAPYRGILGLNEVELSRLKMLRQEKGFFSECLIKTPFSSRLARLYPTREEHDLLRTDNIRAEALREQLALMALENQSERKAICGGI